MADDRAERTRLYERVKDELVAAQRSNAEQFDRSVLTLSTAFLALSVSFMKDVVPFVEMVCGWLLYLSWILFASAISLAMLGMLYGQSILKKMIAGAEEYYLNQNAEAYRISEELPKRIELLNIAVGSLFAVAVFLTVTYVIANLSGREMTQKPRSTQPIVERGQPANTFPKVPTPSTQPATSDSPKPSELPLQPTQAPTTK